jgi:hypothetical protein
MAFEALSSTLHLQISRSCTLSFPQLTTRLRILIVLTNGNGMTSPTHTNGRSASERTPLLSYNGPGDYAGNDSAVQLDEDDIQAAKVDGRGGLEPGQLPDLGKGMSHSHSPWLAPDEDATGRPEPEDVARFQENGLISGVSRTKFRCIFGGILLGYFVGSVEEVNQDFFLM